jgi:hypothetical protein
MCRSKSRKGSEKENRLEKEQGHWLTTQLAEEWVERARAAGKLIPPQAAGGSPDSGPLAGITVALQCCDCCDNLLLFVDARQIDSPVLGPEDLILNIRFLEEDSALTCKHDGK